MLGVNKAQTRLVALSLFLWGTLSAGIIYLNVDKVLVGVVDSFEK